MRFPSLKQACVQGKRVLLRLDLNVAFVNGRMADDYDIKVSLPTIRFLRKKGATIIVLSHRGRPGGNYLRTLTMESIAKATAQLARMNLVFLRGKPGPSLLKELNRKHNSSTLFFLENLRFWKGEEANDFSFARQMSSLGDIFVNDAFGNCHRKHASMVLLPKLLPAYAGLQLEREVKILSKLHGKISRPYVIVLGGAKISTKIDLIRYALREADEVVVGGALANTILAAKGMAVGKSMIEENAMRTLKEVELTNPRLHLPVDVVVAKDLRGKVSVRGVGRVVHDEFIYDIGPDTIELFNSIIARARSVVWNGPLGMYEMPAFAKGTRAIARAISSRKIFSIVGGGETTAVIRRLKLAAKISFLSSAGGAMMEFVVGKSLPGLEALMRQKI